MPFSKSDAKLYVWIIGTAAARLAAGTAPATAPTLAESGTGANNDNGVHLVAIAFETNTGFITKPGPIATITTTFKKQIDVTNIPVGGSHIVARWVLYTKSKGEGIAYTNNPNDYEFFLLHRIADNVTTVYTINTFDTNLVDSGDYLFDQLVDIPNARGVTYFDNKLIVFGMREDRNVMRSSLANEPESFNSVDGNIILAPKTRNGIYAVATHRSILYIFTEEKTFFTTDNEDTPSTWKVSVLDSSVGIAIPTDTSHPSRGVARFREVPGGTIDDVLLISTNTGLRVLNGFYGDDLTYNIRSYTSPWDLFDELLVDPVTRKIYLGNFINGQYIVGDFNDGLNRETIRWSEWLIDTTAIENEPETYTLFFRFTVDPLGGVYAWCDRWRMTYLPLVPGADGGSADNGSLVMTGNNTWIYRFPFVTIVPGWINHFTGLILDATFTELQVDRYLVDNTSDTFGTMTSTLVNKEHHRPINVVNEQMSIELGRSNLSIEISRLDVFGYKLWAHRLM
jgi:hypothetical protein